MQFTLCAFREWGTFFCWGENDHLKWVYWQKIFALTNWFVLLLLLLLGLSIYWAHFHLINFYLEIKFDFDCYPTHDHSHSVDFWDRGYHSRSGCPIVLLPIHFSFACSSLYNASFYFILYFYFFIFIIIIEIFHL